jgi:hypothetical protein
MSNILKAIQVIVGHYASGLSDNADSSNRMNAMGEGLEQFIKDAFANSFNLTKAEKIQSYASTFSYLGSQNHIPDMMLKGSDAIEVKKNENRTSSLVLNSSYPKAYLNKDYPKLKQECRDCETWTVKDLLYVIGTVTKKTKNLNQLWMLYGNCFAAGASFYESLLTDVSQSISTNLNDLVSETEEISRLNAVDPLKITNLRVRGMWETSNPSAVFDYLKDVDLSFSGFQLYCLMKREKYLSMSEVDRTSVEEMKDDNFTISDVKIQNPNNPADLIDAVFIVFREKQ